MENNKIKQPEHIMDNAPHGTKIVNSKAPDNSQSLPDTDNCILMDNIPGKISKIREDSQNNTTVENKNKLK